MTFHDVVRRLAATRKASLAGLVPAAKALYAVHTWHATGKPVIVVCDGSRAAETLYELTCTFFDILAESTTIGRPQLIPALDVLPAQQLSPHSEISEQRAIGLWRLAMGTAPITITPVTGAMLRTRKGDYYRHLALTIRLGEEIAQDDLAAHLVSIGYERREPVEMVGEFSIRGGIVDIFPAEADRPIRMEMFGDLIESMRKFDVDTQRSVLKVDQTTLLPLVEYPRTELSASGWEFRQAVDEPREYSIFDIADRPVVLLDEPEQIKAAGERLWIRLDTPPKDYDAVFEPVPPEKIFHTWDDFEQQLKGKEQLEFRQLSLEESSGHISTRPAMAFHGNIQAVIAETRSLVEKSERAVFFAASTGEVERLADVFTEYSLPFTVCLDSSETVSYAATNRGWSGPSAGNILLAKGAIRRGVSFPEEKLTVFGSEDLFDSSDLVAHPATNKSAAAAFAADLADLKPGDYVVHVTHGVGRFAGLKELGEGDQKGDFMVLEYAADAKLYVPLTRLDLVQKYRGAGDNKPGLDKLGGVTWTKTKSRVKAKMRDMADELIKLYAQRKMATGYAFSADGNWQREFEDAFDYTPTKDQLQAVREIKNDMESDQPMDRLLCGDVGFGKTEVAMRAAFKALGDGKQVALLAPTTVLCFQHFETFKRRFAPFPARVEMLSRFRSAKEISQVLEDVAAGKVDVVIGTHRLLSKDVEFADLGLMIIDEEQRFGVRHKERLKQVRSNIDSLTMSATPIPRTLHMSLLGLRDMSVIETPPKDRLAIHTVVAHFNQDLIKTAIEQELSRGGQVYFVHNRVESIYARAASIQEALPNCRVTVGHGQMGEEALEKVLLGFMRKEYDVFVCTTIVENGLDIPLANTIIMENAERYGLSELYQLRGRVGRSNRRAYAYLLVPEGKELSEIARKRLAALKEFSDLGAGFKIAALDLELRGAGNLLGGEQHGQIEAVGYDMYMKMLEETVRELRGEEVPPEVHSSLNLGLDLRIPSEYVSDENQRLRAYKRMADLKDAEGAAKMLEELEDRYGPVPGSVRLLVEFSQLKTLAQNAGIEAIDRRQGMLNVKFHQGARIDPNQLMALVSGTPGAQFTPAGILRLPCEASVLPEDLLLYLQQCVAGLV